MSFQTNKETILVPNGIHVRYQCRSNELEEFQVMEIKYFYFVRERERVEPQEIQPLNIHILGLKLPTYLQKPRGSIIPIIT